MQPYSVTLGCSDNVAGASWLVLPNYARRATSFRSSQIRKHRAFTLDTSIILNPAVGNAGAAREAQFHCAAQLLRASPNG